MPVRIKALRAHYDQFVVVEDYLTNRRNVPRHLQFVLPGRGHSFRNGSFVHGLGKIAGGECFWFLDGISDAGAANDKPPPFSTFATVAARGWTIGLLKNQARFRGVQCDFRLGVDILPAGLFRVHLEVRLHFPGKATVERASTVLAALNPDPPSWLNGQEMRLAVSRGRTRSEMNCAELFGTLRILLKKKCLVSSAEASISVSRPRLGIWLERVYPWPKLPEYASELRGLLLQDPHWSSVSNSRLEPFKTSAWGKFALDAVVLRKDRALWSFIPPSVAKGRDATYTRHFLERSMMEPWIVAGAQNAYYEFLKELLAKAYHSVFEARRRLREKLRHMTRARFFSPEIVAALDHLSEIHRRMPSPRRKCYHELALHYRLRQCEGDTRQLLEKLVREADQWKMPLGAPLGPFISAARKFLLGG